jgi:hypothetical protein
MAPVLDAAHRLVMALDEFEESAGNYIWGDHGETISLEEIVYMMHRIGARPIICDPPSSGRPSEAWHRAARDVARLVRNVLRDAGFKRNLTATDEGSPIAIVGAQVISRAYQIRIQPAGFASAMRGRKRAKSTPKKFDERFPGAARIRVVPIR